VGALELERRARVVVEPAYERRVDHVGDAVRVEVSPHLFEVQSAGLTERLTDLRGLGEGIANSGTLDVEDLKRAGLPLVACVLVEYVRMRVEPFVQLLDVLRAAVHVTDRVQVQLPPRYPEAP